MVDGDLVLEAPLAVVESTSLHDDLRAAANVIARAEVADAVSEALHEDGRSLRDLEAATGLDPAFVSKLANGRKGVTVASLAFVALALGKTLRISID